MTSRTVKIVCISDTHGRHRDVQIPDGDILVHAGDWTHFGKKRNADDFNAWLGTLPHQHKVVVNGNHEVNAPWQRQVKAILSNATHLVNETVTLRVGVGDNDDAAAVDVVIHGTEFYWPMEGRNLQYAPLARKGPGAVDVLVCHGPVKGFVDGGSGCGQLRQVVAAVRPRLCVSGHIHFAHGVVRIPLPDTAQQQQPPPRSEDEEALVAFATGELVSRPEPMASNAQQCIFVNAANCRKGYSIGYEAVVVDIQMPHRKSAPSDDERREEVQAPPTSSSYLTNTTQDELGESPVIGEGSTAGSSSGGGSDSNKTGQGLHRFVTPASSSSISSGLGQLGGHRSSDDDETEEDWWLGRIGDLCMSSEFMTERPLPAALLPCLRISSLGEAEGGDYRLAASGVTHVFSCVLAPPDETAYEAAKRRLFGKEGRITNNKNDTATATVPAAEGQPAAVMVIYRGGVSSRDETGYPMLDLHYAVFKQFMDTALTTSSASSSESSSEEKHACVLVHCTAGVNRSGVLAVAYVMQSQRWPLLKALRHCLQARGPLVWNETFQKQLYEFARREGLLVVDGDDGGAGIEEWRRSSTKKKSTKDRLNAPPPPPQSAAGIFSSAAAAPLHRQYPATPLLEDT